jgi:hypothetical protein
LFVSFYFLNHYDLIICPYFDEVEIGIQDGSIKQHGRAAGQKQHSQSLFGGEREWTSLMEGCVVVGWMSRPQNGIPSGTIEMKPENGWRENEEGGLKGREGRMGGNWWQYCSGSAAGVVG